MAAAVLFLGCALAILLPVAARNEFVGGEFHLTTAQFGPDFSIGNHENADGSHVPLRRTAVLRSSSAGTPPNWRSKPKAGDSRRALSRDTGRGRRCRSSPTTRCSGCARSGESWRFRLQQDAAVSVRVVGIWARGRCEPWWLATNLEDPLAGITAHSDRRMAIEEQIRDTRGARFGLKLVWTQIHTLADLARFALLGGLTVLLLTAIGHAVSGISPECNSPARKRVRALALAVPRDNIPSPSGGTGSNSAPYGTVPAILRHRDDCRYRGRGATPHTR